MNRLFMLLAASAVAFPTVASAAHPIATFNTVAGTFQVELFEDVAPKTVENFLNYVLDGDYNNSFVHRSEPGFVIQGGGYAYPGAPVPISAFPASPAHIPTDAPVVNEFQLSNVHGTIAMAKTSDPNSATSEWFVNLGNNASSLDDPTNSGGFTVFGQVIGDGMQVVDAIAQVPRYNAGGPYGSLPLRNFTVGVDMAVSDQHFVMIPSITTPPPWQNPLDHLDVNGDGHLTGNDVGLIINQFNDGGFRELSSLFSLTDGEDWFFDTSGDNRLTPQDAGRVINGINAMAGGTAAAESASPAANGGSGIELPTASLRAAPEPSAAILITWAAVAFLMVARLSARRSRQTQ